MAPAAPARPGGNGTGGKRHAASRFLGIPRPARPSLLPRGHCAVCWALLEVLGVQVKKTKTRAAWGSRSSKSKGGGWTCDGTFVNDGAC